MSKKYNLNFSSFRGSKINYKYQLLQDGFSKSDISKGVNVLKSHKITMGHNTHIFEKKFAKKMGVKYALMVNSGSSANLLATFASCNPLRKNRFFPGDEALIPSLCWPTSLWPLVQAGLKPKFIDIDPETLNVQTDKLIKKINKKTKVIMLINVHGISSDVEKITRYAKKRNIIVIEDNCEALGAKFKNKYLGTFGDFGTFSFFYSHQITSGEGGMITCNSRQDYEILLALRSHGWSRGPNLYQFYAKKYPSLDPRYIFINMGFNLRPTDIQAAIAKNQFDRLKKIISIRTKNRLKIINSISKDPRYKSQFYFIKVPKNVKPSFMALPIVLDKKFKKLKKKYIHEIENHGLETRPIISGSFVNQPSAKLFNLNPKKEKFVNANYIQDNGFVIGLHTKNITSKNIKFLKETLFLIDKI